MTFSVPKSFVPDTTAKAADLNENSDAIEAAINELLEAVTPVGTLIATARSSAPTGYLLCEGQAVSRTKYASLFGAIGTAYGTGDGSTTFNLPDLRGRVPVGVDGGANRLSENKTLGAAGGHKNMPKHSHGPGTLGTGPESAFHQHERDMQVSTRHDGSGSAYDVWQYTPAFPSKSSNPTSQHIHGVVSGRTADEGSGPSGGDDRMQPFQIVNWAIKV